MTPQLAKGAYPVLRLRFSPRLVTAVATVVSILAMALAGSAATSWS
jgi:hypothetical protein